MLNHNFHLTDKDLLLLADGELSRWQAVRSRAHLTACWTCRTRMGEIERTIADFSRLHESEMDSNETTASLSRTRLKTQLAALAAGSRPPRWPAWLRSALDARAAAFVLAALFVAAVGIQGIHHYRLRRESGQIVAGLEPWAVPNRTLTPGGTRPVTRYDVCSVRANDESAHAIPAKIEQQVFREYGMPNARPSDYEVDYLITPELGGSDDLRNLWPEPHGATAWNSYVKDALEDRLHQLVCNGNLDLATAQHDIATDWIGAYKKYFHTEVPFSIRSNLNSSPHRTPSS